VWNGNRAAGEPYLRGSENQINQGACNQTPAGLLLPARVENGQHFGAELAAERSRKKEQQRGH